MTTTTFKISNHIVIDGLSNTHTLLDRKNNIHLLSSVLVSVANRRVVFYVNDIQNQVQYTREDVDVDVAQPFSFLINGKRLLDILKTSNPDALIGFEISDHRIRLSIGRSHFDFSCLSVEDYPHEPFAENPEQSDQKRLDISSKNIIAGIESTSFAMAVQDVRYYLNGLNLTFDEQGQLKFSATDGHRMAITRLPHDGDKQDIEWILQAKAVQEIMRFAKQTEGEKIAFYSQGNSIECHFANGVKFRTKCIDGKFPNVDKVIPREGLSRMTLRRETLLQALKRVELFTSDKFKGIKFLFSPEGLALHAINNENEEGREFIESADIPSSLEIGLNVNYVLQYLTTAKGQEIEVSVKDANTPALFRETDRADGENIYVVMSMKI
ncbi:DNA polymerase III subunit beta [Amphibiibacter pelophylacis]|uniref:DNA polymerase III subunit beta n=1 Tax=Amphibiibacter pelophylacis TaxID=1799477 RepID=A0ACC6P1D2_9BURK